MTQTLAFRVKLAATFGSFSLAVDFTVAEGPIVILGPNGAGKTSLLSLMLGAAPCRHGMVEVAGEVLLDTPRHVCVALEERRLGYVPQHAALFPHLNVEQNLAFALRAARRYPKHAAVSRIEATLASLGLTDLRHSDVRTLSGGERQRVALARALITEPRALLLDEPLAALDVSARGQVRQLLVQTLHTLKLPTLVVSHDREDARALARHIIVLEAGRITQQGTWDELVAAPASAFVRHFVEGAAPH